MKRKPISTKFGIALTAMRGHLAKCPSCKAVLKGGRAGNMCEEGVALTHQTAQMSLALTALHRKAYNDPQHFVYACPDRTKHGKDYASTAEPHVNVAVQPELF
jgi:hypothetical protein